MSRYPVEAETIELKAGGLDDPDANRAATALAAYFHAEHVRAFRRRLWPRLAGLAMLWLLVTVPADLFSAGTVVGGLAVIASTGVWAAILEWQAEDRLAAVMRERRGPRRHAN